MKAKRIFSIAAAILKAKIFKKQTPLLVGWAITGHCNRKCGYCARWQGNSGELSTAQILRVIDQLARLGCLRISFTGGEPLLRSDIGQIIDYAHNKGIEVRLNSNGDLVSAKKEQLKNLDALTLSLEGPVEIHDAIRGAGSYQKVIQAAKTARELGIKVTLTTVLTRLNCDQIDFILAKAQELAAEVSFQPATPTVLGDKQANPLQPTETQYRQAMQQLIKKKKTAGRTIANSKAGLAYLYHWPRTKRLTCAAGVINARIEPNGEVIYCSRDKFPNPVLSCANGNFQEAFANLKPISCSDCCCANRVELNLCFRGNLSAILNQIKR
ncbi:radical SAM protein [Candidatus Omnitrophota bacterium]